MKNDYNKGCQFFFFAHLLRAALLLWFHLIVLKIKLNYILDEQTRLRVDEVLNQDHRPQGLNPGVLNSEICACETCWAISTIIFWAIIKIITFCFCLVISSSFRYVFFHRIICIFHTHPHTVSLEKTLGMLSWKSVFVVAVFLRDSLF